MSIERSISKTSRTVLSGGASGRLLVSYTLLKAIGVALTLGVLMSGCTTPPAPGASPTISKQPPKNPHEAIGGYPVSPNQDLKNAAMEAYNLHRELVSLVDPSYFSGNFTPIKNERSSSETPPYKDGESYWRVGSGSRLIGGVDTNALFEKMKSYLESKGYAMTKDNRDGKRPGPAGTVDFRKDGAVSYINLGVNGNSLRGQLSIDLITANFPNPPVSEWPKPGQNETWRPDVKLWPAGIGAVEPTPPPITPGVNP